ncbi:hypothetical protein ACU3L3_08405 [Priestia endophytica]|jgi:hypothetical protein|uniref:hypothetical protein n=1 Tax=Priestia endophytica TaxID=135735 RepID=UPI00077C8B26|nr:hypothetical protein [Priestia endophytica]KYG27400.1 hypothetical protein AZF06_14390 [Priestia endophytica]MBG9814452.1 hypothetical protein [Priestia endophytica]
MNVSQLVNFIYEGANMRNDFRIRLMKGVAFLLLFSLVAFTQLGPHLSQTTIGIIGFIIFLVYILSDVLFEEKRWTLKLMHTYLSTMLFIVGIIEMHRMVTTCCIIGILMVPYLIEELK